MTLLHHALRAGRSNARAATAPSSGVVVAGGGGALGSAVLEHLLASRRFAPVRVLVTRDVHVAVAGLEPLVADPPLDAGDEHSSALPLASTAVVVFDRPRHANGRELAFTRPQPEALPALARWLWQRGVRQLVVVLPHSPAGLPQAMQAGLANLDEHAVSALGFEHLVFVRSAQAASGARSARWLQRVADALLAQFSIMVAAPQQPVRARKVAQLVVALAQQLPDSPPGTRVAPPELVWQAAQAADPAALVGAWLAGEALPVVSAPRQRL